MSREYETSQQARNQDRKGAATLWLIVALPVAMLMAVNPGQKRNALYQYNEGEYACTKNWTPSQMKTGIS